MTGPDTLTLPAADAAFIADALHLAGRFLIRAHIHDAGLLRGVASLTRQAAAMLPPGSWRPITDHEEDQSPAI